MRRIFSPSLLGASFVRKQRDKRGKWSGYIEQMKNILGFASTPSEYAELGLSPATHRSARLFCSNDYSRPRHDVAPRTASQVQPSHLGTLFDQWMSYAPSQRANSSSVANLRPNSYCAIPVRSCDTRQHATCDYWQCLQTCPDKGIPAKV